MAPCLCFVMWLEDFSGPNHALPTGFLSQPTLRFCAHAIATSKKSSATSQEGRPWVARGLCNHVSMASDETSLIALLSMKEGFLRCLFCMKTMLLNVVVCTASSSFDKIDRESIGLLLPPPQQPAKSMLWATSICGHYHTWGVSRRRGCFFLSSCTEITAKWRFFCEAALKPLQIPG